MSGGLIGKPNEPTTLLASGVWGLRKQLRARKDGLWPTSDPYFSSVSLLLLCDGVNGSTNFIDSGPLALTIGVVGNSQISTTQSKFGGSSVAFDGDGDYISAPAGTHFNFGTGDWTIEFWIRTTQTDAAWAFGLGGNNSGGWAWRYNFTSVSRVELLENSTSRITATGTSINDGNWHHIAITRSGNSVRMFLDGTQIGSTYTTGVSYGNSSDILRIGWTVNGVASEAINGWLDEIRITKGIARYTTTFTPPDSFA